MQSPFAAPRRANLRSELCDVFLGRGAGDRAEYQRHQQWQSDYGPAERASARAAIDQALALMDGVTAKEQDWIRAPISVTTVRPTHPVTHRSRLANALADMASRYPDDTTVASVYAEALMNTMPDYWGPDGEAKPDTQAVIASLEAVMDADPDHPLALHLYIHALEASSNAAKAEPAADRLADLVPGSGHLVHMPSHIYFRVGRYQDSALANIRAAEVDEAYIAQCNAQGFYPALYYPHNIHFLWASATMQGQSALSLDSAEGGCQCPCRAGGAAPNYSALPYRTDALFGEVCTWRKSSKSLNPMSPLRLPAPSGTTGGVWPTRRWVMQGLRELSWPR